MSPLYYVHSQISHKSWIYYTQIKNLDLHDFIHFTNHFRQYSTEIEGRVFTVSSSLYRAKGLNCAINLCIEETALRVPMVFLTCVITPV